MANNSEVRYLVFDVESIADGELIQRTKYAEEDLTPSQAITRYQEELVAKRGEGKDMIPYTFMLPISVAVAKVSADFQLIDAVTLDSPEYRPSVISKHFWEGWRKYQRPTFVTFNGRGFDIPLMELAAFRYGLSLKDWYCPGTRSFDQPRYRFNDAHHLDLMELMTNYGSSRMTGGLNLLANLIGKPGKLGVDGSMVQSMHDDGKVEEINDYCLCDVLDTYFVFLRCAVLRGELTLQREQECVEQAKEFLEANRSRQAFETYLAHWGDWEPPNQ